MIDVFKSLKGLVKLDNIKIDNIIFRLHYKVTVVLLITFSILVTCRQFIGDPINCAVADGVPGKVMDNYCWMHSYTVTNYHTGRVGKDFIHPGVAPQEDEEDIKYLNYYQWVCFVLFFQGVMFYIPRLVWKKWEAGLIRMLVYGRPTITEDFINLQNRTVANYFIKNLHFQNQYAYRYLFCEFLNLANVFAQAFFIDVFLGFEFSTYGHDVIEFVSLDPEERIDPMARVFPKIVKCTFNKYGPTGTIQNIDGLCVLPLNIVNEKVYVFLWFWFLFLTMVSVLSFIFRVIVFCTPTLREVVLRISSRFSTPAQIKLITWNCQIGDWFLLSQLSRNMDPLNFAELITILSERIEAIGASED